MAWKEFRRGKRKKSDVQAFEFNLEDNLFSLRELLVTKTYQPDPYESFYVCDPKLRHIHKASVRDRVLHQAVFRVLYHIFDQHFIFDSYSCRSKKGTHRAVRRLTDFLRKESHHYTRSIYALKCDVRKFFDSIDQPILIDLIKKKIDDQNALWLIETIIRSFGKGLPLGNVTSQLFANIYLNELDQYMKHDLKTQKYIRYCDDCIIVNEDKKHLTDLIPRIDRFLNQQLKLELHPKKIILRKFSWGIDFLGWVHFPHHRILRTTTRRRMMRRLRHNASPETIASYRGLLRHGNTRKLQVQL